MTAPQYGKLRDRGQSGKHQQYAIADQQFWNIVNSISLSIGSAGIYMDIEKTMFQDC